MKNLCVVLIIILHQIAYSQSEINTDPIFIVNGEIVTKEKVEEYNYRSGWHYKLFIYRK